MRPVPWFRSHHLLALGLAAAMFAGVFGLRLAVAGESDAITLLYVLPIALLALAGGVRVGVGAGAFGVALIGAWVQISGVHLTPLGWISRMVPMLLLGYLVGRAAEGLEAAALLERQLLAARLREREAAEINDSIIQGLAVAKWQMESGNDARALELLTETMEQAQQLVSDLLKGRPITAGMFRRHEPA